MKKRILALTFSIIALVSVAKAQQPEVTITLNEQFFDALLDAMFKNTTPPEFPISANSRESRVWSRDSFVSSFAEDQRPKSRLRGLDRPKVCSEVIRLKRENEGVKTS